MNSFLADAELIAKITLMVHEGHTGSAYVFGKAIGCSKRTMNRHIKAMNKILQFCDIQLIFDKSIDSYKFSGEGTIIISIVWKNKKDQKSKTF